MKDANCEFTNTGVFSEIPLTAEVEPIPLQDKITWNLIKDSDDIPGRSKEIKVCKRVFFRIGQYIPVRFKNVSEFEDADISITVRKDDEYFVNRPNALAYAYLGTFSQPIDIVFNESYIWVLNRESGMNRYDMEIVLIHEVLHSLGLRHSSTPGSVLAPNYGGIADLSAEDIENLQTIWGIRPRWSQRIKWLAGYLSRLI